MADDILGKKISAGNYVIYYRNGKNTLGLVREIITEISPEKVQKVTIRLTSLVLDQAPSENWPKAMDVNEHEVLYDPADLCIVNFVPENFLSALGDYHATL